MSEGDKCQISQISIPLIDQQFNSRLRFIFLLRLGWRGNGSWLRGRRKAEAVKKQKGQYSVHHMLTCSYMFIICSHAHICCYVHSLIYWHDHMLLCLNMQIISTFHLVFCRKRPQATVRPSSREESVDKEEKEENGTERKRFSPFHQFYIYLKKRKRPERS